MSEIDLSKIPAHLLETELARRGRHQILPIPEVIDHDFRPGDEIEDTVPNWAQGIVRKAESTELAAKLDFVPQRGVILAVASRADVLIRFHESGRVAFRLASSKPGKINTASIHKIDLQKKELPKKSAVYCPACGKKFIRHTEYDARCDECRTGKTGQSL